MCLLHRECGLCLVVVIILRCLQQRVTHSGRSHRAATVPTAAATGASAAAARVRQRGGGVGLLESVKRRA